MSARFTLPRWTNSTSRLTAARSTQRPTSDMRSAGQPSSVHHQIRARDVGSEVAAEEDGRIGYILRTPQPGPRCAAQRVVEQLGVLGAAGQDLSRRNAVTDNQLPGIVHGDLPRHVDGPGLTDSVGCLGRTANDTVLRPEVDDPASH